MTPENIIKIFKIFKKSNPNPQTELIYKNNFELLVSVLLSAQATDKGVNKATEKLFLVANTPEQILNLGEEKLLEFLKSLNYYKTKTKNLIKTSEILTTQYQGQIPRSREGLESLPGVGRKTANVILNIAFGEKTIAVDTHIFRVANRLNLAPGKDVLEVEKNLEKNIPPEFLKNAHHWLVLHGRYVCKAAKPKCSECLIKNYCPYVVSPLRGRDSPDNEIEGQRGGNSKKPREKK